MKRLTFDLSLKIPTQRVPSGHSRKGSQASQLHCKFNSQKFVFPLALPRTLNMV